MRPGRWPGLAAKMAVRLSLTAQTGYGGHAAGRTYGYDDTNCTATGDATHNFANHPLMTKFVLDKYASLSMGYPGMDIVPS